MSRYNQTSTIDYVGDSRDPEIIYYNASIVNNNTNDVDGATGANIIDPAIRFNETRDTAIVRDCSKYQFSIVRFVVNGGNLDLPLFIPAIQSGTGQTDINLTEYGCAITYSDSTGTNNLTSGPLSYVNWVPEYRNPGIAPLPRTTASPDYVGTWQISATYSPGQIVYYTPNQTYYQALSPPNPPYTAPNSGIVPPSNTIYWSATSPELGQPQDISSRYYWCSTYAHFLGLLQTALENANLACWTAWVTKNTAVAPYATYNDWLAYHPVPVVTYNPDDTLFSISYPPSYLPATQQTQYGYTPAPNTPVLGLYFNTNLYALFANFKADYYNTISPFYTISPTGVGILFPSRWYYPNPTAALETFFPEGYAYELQVDILGAGKNIGRVGSLANPPVEGNALVVMTQDYNSTSTLWSPCDALVFTTAQIPIQNEAVAPPNALGTKNIGNSAPTSKSAFLPIITDVSLPLSSDPAGYRKQLYYAPAAEYRMADFQNSKQDIRTVDVSVFWRNRLDNSLYPVSMFNLSSVSIKLMFRKKAVLAKSERMGMF
jgi:hypothetical protein